MRNILNFYLDESGSKCPDRNPKDTLAKHGSDFFAYGGILIEEQKEKIARNLYQSFCSKWNITYPLHSTDIRHSSEHFHWLNENNNKRSTFLTELSELMKQIPVIGIACTIDRPGYNHRYEAKYGDQRWRLCKTAFNIVVERATKYSKEKGCKLRVLPERCNKKDDNTLKRYYNELKTKGMPFDQNISSSYDPLKPEDFSNILYEFKTKYKSSPMAQIADLYLWPMAMGGYDKNNKPYQHLLKNKKLIDCLYSEDQISSLGIKYSCFDLVTPKV